MLIARKPSRTGSRCAKFTKDPLPSNRSTGRDRQIAAMARIHAFRTFHSCLLPTRSKTGLRRRRRFLSRGNSSTMRKDRGNIPVTFLKRDILEQQQLKFLLLTVFACLGILYLTPKTLSILNVGSGDYFDFQLFWQAGKSWATGQNPYEAVRTAVSTWFTHLTGIR